MMKLTKYLKAIGAIRSESVPITDSTLLIPLQNADFGMSTEEVTIFHILPHENAIRRAGKTNMSVSPVAPDVPL